MCTSFSTLTLHVLLHLTLSNALQVSWPQVFENERVITTWQGGSAPFRFQVRDLDNNIPIVDLSGINAAQQPWFVTASAGQTIIFIVSDSAGDSSQSPNTTVQLRSPTPTDSQSTSTQTTTATSNSGSSPTSRTTSSTASSSPSTLASLDNGGTPPGGNSIRYIAGILGGVCAITASVFLWRCIRAYLRRRSLERYAATSGYTWWTPKGDPKPNMVQVPGRIPPAARDIEAVPNPNPSLLKRASDENLLLNRGNIDITNRGSQSGSPDSLSSHNHIAFPMSCVTSSHDGSYETESVSSIDMARASSTMLPITPANDFASTLRYPLPTVHRSVSRSTLGTKRSFDVFSPSSSSPSFRREHSVRQLSVPSSPNPFEDAVFQIPIATASTLRSPFGNDDRISTEFPQDATYLADDEISAFSLSHSPTLGSSATGISSNRANRDYPTTPTTSHSY